MHALHTAYCRNAEQPRIPLKTLGPFLPRGCFCSLSSPLKKKKNGYPKSMMYHRRDRTTMFGFAHFPATSCNLPVIYPLPPPPPQNRDIMSQGGSLVSPKSMPMECRQYILPRLPGIALATAYTRRETFSKPLTLFVDQSSFRKASTRGPRQGECNASRCQTQSLSTQSALV